MLEKFPQPLSDGELLRMMRENNKGAFEEIYNKYWSRLYLSAYNLLRDREAAEDIVQEIMVQLWVRRATIVIDSLPSYLYQAVRFQVFKCIRKAKVFHLSLQEVEDIATENNIETNLAVKDIYEKLDMGIAGLPERCRRVFTLSRKEQLSTKEIAAMLNITPKTVENQLTIAIRRLRSTIGHLFLILVFLLFI